MTSVPSSPPGYAHSCCSMLAHALSSVSMRQTMLACAATHVSRRSQQPAAQLRVVCERLRLRHRAVVDEQVLAGQREAGLAAAQQALHVRWPPLRATNENDFGRRHAGALL